MYYSPSLSRHLTVTPHQKGYRLSAMEPSARTPSFLRNDLDPHNPQLPAGRRAPPIHRKESSSSAAATWCSGDPVGELYEYIESQGLPQSKLAIGVPWI